MPTSARRRKNRKQTHQVSSTPAITRSPAPDPLQSAGPAEREPAHSDIARRAFHRFEERRHEHGNDLDDWLDAERELRQPQPQERFVESEDDDDDAA